MWINHKDTYISPPSWAWITFFMPPGFTCSSHWCYCLVTQSCPVPLWSHGLSSARLLCPWDFPGKNTGAGDLTDPEIEPVSPALQEDSLPLRFLGSPVTPIHTTDNTRKDCIKFPLTEASLRYSSAIIKENVKKQKKRWEFWPHAQNPLYRCCLCMGRVHFSSIQSVMSSSLWPHGLQHTRPPCPSPTLRAYSNSCPSSWWCHPTISSSVVLFFSCLQFSPTWESFLMSRLCTSGGQSIGASPSPLVPPMNIQDRFPLGWTGWISLQSKGLSRVFSNTTV